MESMNRKFVNRKTRQSGMTLVEILVAMVLSMITTGAMLGLMSSSLSSTAGIVQQTKLTDDLRVAMTMMSRDLRRSNYTADSIHCYANPDCAFDGSLDMAGDVQISDGGDCFVFNLDRDSDGDASADAGGGFRWVVNEEVGELQAWTGAGAADCAATDANWRPVTDTTVLDVTGLQVDDSLSYEEVIFDDGEGTQYSQRVRRVRINISGRLRSNESVQRTLEDVVKLRNNVYL
jgi:prepilin-type N-terminal cleavage/methylation domain-containing protein